MDLGFQNKHILVTGASGGLGVVTAEEFLKQGANVTCHYNRNSDTLDRLVKSWPFQTFTVQADVTDEEAVISCIATAVDKFGPINVLIVNHAIWPTEDVGIKDMSLQQWKNTLDVNMTGSFLFIRSYLKQIEKYHVTDNVAIVMVGSTAGKFGEAYHADYASTKSAIMTGLTLSLKNEIVKIAPKGRVNAVAPGWIRTPMAERAMQDPDLLYQAMASSPLRKVSEPVDVARSILFLASEVASGNITGHVLDINAGMEGRLLNKREDFS